MREAFPTFSLRTRGRYDARLTPHREEKTPVIQRLLGEFGDSEADATALYWTALKVLTNYQRCRQLTEEQQDTCVLQILRDLLRVYKEGTMESWMPSLEVLFRA